jgi:hypothetical protein
MEEVLYRLNPWWTKEFKEDSIIRNKYLDKIKEESEFILFLTGLRRVGKTTILKQYISHLLNQKKIHPKKILFLNLDHIELMNLTIHQIIGEYKKINSIAYDDFFYLFLDEVTSKEGFEQELKNLYDIGNIKIFCSSSIASLMNDKKAYLTGRTRTIEVMPLDYNEYLMFKNVQIKKFDKALHKHHFEAYMKTGGIPRYVLTEDMEYLNELLNSIIYKDIIARYNISNEKIIKELFRLLCQRIGKPTSYNKLSKILGISNDTVKKYITYFEKSYLFFSIEKYSHSVNENITSPRKFYICDLGIKNLISSNKEKGSDFENLVFLKIKNENPFYFIENGIEIDFINDKMAIEAKYDDAKMNEKQKRVFENLKQEKQIIKGHEFFIE